MAPDDRLREQLVQDLDRLHGVILRVARGDRAARLVRDRLESAVGLKLALLKGICR